MDYRKLLSKHRTSLMGLAALLILCYHSAWTHAPFPLGQVCQHGQIGVDIFIFMMGFSLARALRRRPDLYRYYGRRLDRLLPAYYSWFVAMAAIAVFMKVFLHQKADYASWFILHILPVGVWINKLPDAWFVSAALGYYALAPLLYRLLERSKRPWLATALVVALTGLALPTVSGMNRVGIALMRFSPLMVGLCVGNAAVEPDGAGSRAVRGLICLAALACAVVPLNRFAGFSLLARLTEGQRYRLTLGWTAPLLCVLLVLLLEVVGRTPLKIVNRLLSRLGEYSLEMYLSHIVLNALVRDYLKLPKPLVFFILLATCYPLARACAFSSGIIRGVWNRLSGKWMKPADGEREAG